MHLRLKLVSAAFVMGAVLLGVQLVRINHDSDVKQAASGRGQYKLSNVSEYASIYDRSGKRLVNEEAEFYALVLPDSSTALRVLPYAYDKEMYKSGMNGNLPFLCRVTAEEIDGITVFKRYKRNSDHQLAVHILGYTSEDKGMCGIEYAYDDFLRGTYSENKAQFSVNAVGEVLEGLYSSAEKASPVEAGVITSIDKDIQRICEEVMDSYDGIMGAVVVMDVKSGEIRACASYPKLELDRLEESLDESTSPFINRAFLPYSVGSVFKLCIAAAALESGISPDFTYTCTGSVNVNGQIFNCHKWGGHGEIDMHQAMELSCNPYFIALSEYIDNTLLIDTAKALGFGTETVFAEGMTSSSGYLPSEAQLEVPAEKGNLSFGQGMLTATPVQICRMTAAIANNGMCPAPKLVTAIKESDGSLCRIKYPVNKRAVSYLTALKLREFMTAVVNSENSMSRSYIVSSGGKTSTAQTGRISSDGSEEMNCWFTGYFPSDHPRYAVTVLVEDGISGNVTSSPVYKKIAERITAYEKKIPVIY